MDARMIVTLVVFLFMIVSFSLHKFPMALTAILGMLALVVTGCVEPKTALSNIGSSTVSWCTGSPRAPSPRSWPGTCW